MNKIVIVNNEIIESQIDDAVKVVSGKGNFDGVCKINISVVKNTNLMIEYDCKDESKLEMYFNISPFVSCNIYELKRGKCGKFSYKFYVLEDALLNLYKFNDIDDNKEQVIFNLNGNLAKLNYNFKTISSFKEKYDLLVYHNFSNTESLVNNYGVNVKKGDLKFNVSSFVPKGNGKCIINQNGRIINLTNNTCQINPNLFIDDYDCVANHSAHIGKCNSDELFYLMSRGIAYKKAETLLIKGFLLKDSNVLSKDILKSINKYWR